MTEGLEHDDDGKEDDRERGEKDRERDLVRRLLAARAFDEADHPVEERVAALDRDPDEDAVGEHLRAAGDRRAVTARLADDRRRLAGDRRLVDRGDAFDDLAVRRDDVACFAHDDVALRRARRRRRGSPHRPAPRSRASVSARILRSVSACALPATLGDRLGEVGEQDREEQPDRHRPGEDPGVGDRLDEGDDRRRSGRRT